MLNKRVILLSIVFLFFSICAFGQIDFHQLYPQLAHNEMSFSYNLYTVYYIENEIKRVREFNIFSRIAEEKMVKIQLLPKIGRGTGFLQIGDSLWYYDSYNKSFSVRALPAREDAVLYGNGSLYNMMDRYEVLGYELQFLGNIEVYAVTLVVIDGQVDFPMVIDFFRTDTLFKVKRQNYGDNGNLLSSEYYLGRDEVDGMSYHKKIVVVDHVEMGNRIEYYIRDFSTDIIEDGVFTKAFLENARGY